MHERDGQRWVVEDLDRRAIGHVEQRPNGTWRAMRGPRHVGDYQRPAEADAAVRMGGSTGNAITRRIPDPKPPEPDPAPRATMPIRRRGAVESSSP